MKRIIKSIVVLEVPTRMQTRSRSHSIRSVPPPELNRRSWACVGMSCGPKSSGWRIKNARVSTLDGYKPGSVYCWRSETM